MWKVFSELCLIITSNYIWPHLTGKHTCTNNHCHHGNRRGNWRFTLQVRLYKLLLCLHKFTEDKYFQINFWKKTLTIYCILIYICFRSSRQRYVLGDNAMKAMAHSNVFLSGLGGLGVEIGMYQTSALCWYSKMQLHFSSLTLNPWLEILWDNMKYKNYVFRCVLLIITANTLKISTKCCVHFYCTEKRPSRECRM